LLIENGGALAGQSFNIHLSPRRRGKSTSSLSALLGVQPSREVT
jgi:hypothetical protein